MIDGEPTENEKKWTVRDTVQLVGGILILLVMLAAACAMMLWADSEKNKTYTGDSLCNCPYCQQYHNSGHRQVSPPLTEEKRVSPSPSIIDTSKPPIWC